MRYLILAKLGICLVGTGLSSSPKDKTGSETDKNFVQSTDRAKTPATMNPATSVDDEYPVSPISVLEYPASPPVEDGGNQATNLRELLGHTKSTMTRKAKKPIRIREANDNPEPKYTAESEFPVPYALGSDIADKEGQQMTEDIFSRVTGGRYREQSKVGKKRGPPKKLFQPPTVVPTDIPGGILQYPEECTRRPVRTTRAINPFDVVGDDNDDISQFEEVMLDLVSHPDIDNSEVEVDSPPAVDRRTTLTPPVSTLHELQNQFKKKINIISSDMMKTSKPDPIIMETRTPPLGFPRDPSSSSSTSWVSETPEGSTTDISTPTRETSQESFDTSSTPTTSDSEPDDEVSVDSRRPSINQPRRGTRVIPVPLPNDDAFDDPTLRHGEWRMHAHLTTPAVAESYTAEDVDVNLSSTEFVVETDTSDDGKSDHEEETAMELEVVAPITNRRRSSHDFGAEERENDPKKRIRISLPRKVKQVRQDDDIPRKRKDQRK